MTYEEVYMARVTAMGMNHKERDLNSRIRDFDELLRDHPSSEDVFINDVRYRASIRSEKQDENKMTKTFLMKLQTPVAPGTIIEWKDRKWLVWFQEQNPNQAYLSNLAVRCNTFVKWVDEYGVENGADCYIVGSMLSVIKGNFRTWNGLITPQPNQFLEMILPTRKMALGQRFLISDRGWQAIEKDVTSVPGVMYISLTEDKRDRMDDDRDDELADAVNLGKWKITTSDSSITTGILDNYLVTVIITNSGEIVNSSSSFACSILDDTIAQLSIVDNQTIMIQPLEIGTTTMKVWLAEDPNVSTTLTLEIVDGSIIDSTYMLVGSDYIRVTQTQGYQIINNGMREPILNHALTLSKAGLATSYVEDDVVYIMANSANIVGSLTLEIQTPVDTYTKDIVIKPLW